jgi:hypothetical protein
MDLAVVDRVEHFRPWMIAFEMPASAKGELAVELIPS